jgi:hypothetical protein
MKALTDALANRKTRVALEADFRSEYGLSLKGIGTGELPYAEAARLLTQLPRDSRLYRLVTEDPLTYAEHMMMSLIDSSRIISYFSMIHAQTQVPKKSWGQVTKHIPEPIPRPGQRPVEKDKQAVTVRSKDAKFAVQRIIKNSMARALTQ